MNQALALLWAKQEPWKIYMTGISCCLTPNSFSSIEIYFSHEWSISVKSPSLEYLVSSISHWNTQPLCAHHCCPESSPKEKQTKKKRRKKKLGPSQSSLSHQGTLRCCNVKEKSTTTTKRGEFLWVTAQEVATRLWLCWLFMVKCVFLWCQDHNLNAVAPVSPWLCESQQWLSETAPRLRAHYFSYK